MDLVKEFEVHVALSIDESGVYPAIGLVITKDDKLEIAAIMEVETAFNWFWDQICNKEAKEVIFGVDRTTEKGQGTEFADVLTCAHWVDTGDDKAWKKSFRIGVINYQHEPRIVRAIDFDNKFWHRKMTRELFNQRPHLRITTVKTEPEERLELSVPEVKDTVFDLAWLKKHAQFLCDNCLETREESQCRPADEYKVYNGQLLCDMCYDNLAWSENMPEWDDMVQFDPFACVSGGGNEDLGTGPG